MSNRGRKAVMTGGCQCGAIRYALYVRPESGVHLCHCRMCQKAVGGPFAALAPVKLEDFAWTRGTPGTFMSSTLAARDFCPNCGTPLTFRYVDRDYIDVTIGSLDRPQDAPPGQHYGTEARVAWLDDIDKWPRGTTEADMPAAARAKLVNFQHPDHDTPDDWAPPAAP